MDALTSDKRKGLIMSEVNTETTETTQAEQGATEGAKTEQTEKMIPQSQMNAVIDKKFAKIEAKHREEIERVRQESLTEGQKLAKMSNDEREQLKREENEKKLAAREQEITRRELRAEAKSQLSDKGLPVELAEILPYSDAEGTNTALEAVEKVFRLAVEKGINERLKGNPPKINQPAANVTDYKDEIKKAIFG